VEDKSEAIIRRYVRMRKHWITLTDRADFVKKRMDNVLADLVVERGSTEAAIDALVDYDLASSPLPK
jgi:hypothetical protein